MAFRLITCPVGPWPVNAYILVCEETGAAAVVDPGADPQEILKRVEVEQVTHILVTHGHEDHVGAVRDVQQVTGAPLYLHPADAQAFQLDYDLPLENGKVLEVGASRLRVIHVPGHTTGLCCFDLGDGRILVGDSVFVGGPGKTWSSAAFILQMQSMREIVFAWPDQTLFYPGHGNPGRIGDERPAFTAFCERGWPEGLFGDVTWVD